MKVSPTKRATPQAGSPAQGAPAASSSNLPPDGLEVWLDDIEVGPLVHMGRLHRSGHAVRFEYAASWLLHPMAFPLDPELGLSGGSFFPVDSNFGVFLDSCPDRWGQTLMKRRELVQASQTGRAARDLRPWDFFLGVQDVTRMGALRFSALQSERQLKKGVPPEFAEGICLASDALAAPALVRLPELQGIALELTRKKVEDLSLLENWLKVLVAPGASLGGARPKANLQDGQGNLWIAKFPAADDDHDWALREILLHQLADKFGLKVAPARLERIGHGYHTFVTRRFDRQGTSRRFFTSAMALLGKTEHVDSSYLEMAEFLSSNGVAGHIEEDLHEMFRRVLFNVAVSNRDDHLRNHGFIRYPGGWRPAPAYDMNLSTKKEAHVLMLDDSSSLPDLTTVMRTAEFYRVSDAEAEADLARLKQVLSTWESAAKALGLSAEDRLELKRGFLL